MLRIVCLSLLVSLSLTAWAQQPTRPQTPVPQAKPQTAKPETVAPAAPLSLQDAVRIGLENNLGIRLARTDEEIAANNVTRGNAGQLPTANGNFARTFNINNSRQQLNNGEPRVVNGGQANALNANVGLNWTVFDGLGMFIAYDRLQTLERLQQQVTRTTLEQTVGDITDAYFAVVRESGNIRALEEALAIGQARIDLTRAQVEVGVSAKVELLTAQVDFNADRSALIQQQEALTTAKINLNTLLSRAPQLDFQPSDSIVVTRTLDRDQVVQGVQQRNPRLQEARLRTEVATYDRRLTRARRYPQVDVTGGYGLTRNINNAIFINTPTGAFLATNVNRVYGPNYGVVASVPIFDGFNQRRLEQNARVAEEQSRLQLDQTRLQLDADAEQAYARYQNRLRLLELEEDNIKLARQNVAIALERYRLGLLTPLVLREAQRNQLDAEVRLLDIRYQAKQAETALRRLSGELVREAQ